MNAQTPQSPQAPMNDNKKVALITGASRGIGRAAALACSRAGYHVIALARSQKALEELDDQIQASGGTATIVPLDLTDLEAIDRLGGAIYQRHGKLDALIHAAATLGDLTPAAHVSVAEGQRLINVNITATWRIIRSMEPLLRAAGHGRAVFFTSGVVARPRPNWSLYGASKAAVEAMVACWAQEVAFVGVGAAVVDPGPVATGMRRKAYPGEDPLTLPPPPALSSFLLELIDGNRAPIKGEKISFRDSAHFAAWQETDNGKDAAARLAALSPA